MPIEIVMPAVTPTMTEGTLVRWLKREGERVARGEAVVEIETDKSVVEVAAVESGILGPVLVADGTEGIRVNAPLALLLAEGEERSSLDRAPVVTEAPPTREEAPPEVLRRNSAPRVFASPLARRLAADAGLDLGRIEGTGPGGRIVKRDVEAAREAAVAPAVAGEPGFTEVPHTPMRKAIARRIAESKRDVPHFYLTVDCCIDALRALRADLDRVDPEGAAPPAITVNDLVVRAAALALRRVPAANASWRDDAIRRYDTVDVAVAVATPRGLITPVVRDADRKRLGELSRELRELATRAREGRLRPEEYRGGGFTVSNLGMYGVKEFAAVINPPQACILAVGAGEARPVVRDGALAVATMMTCTLSVDHRAVDGVAAAEFLAAFRRLIEAPLRMLLGSDLRTTQR